MRRRRMLFWVCAVICLAVVAGTTGFLLYIHSAPKPLPGVDQIIDEVLKSPVPEFIPGKTFFADSGGIKIWCEAIASPTPAKGTVLLIQGYTMGGLWWPEHFYRPLVDAGYTVIVFDHRGLGWSDWVANWNAKHPYSLKDMASDCVAILDAQRTPKAHVIGISMGGMIAMHLALEHPERLASLTTLMAPGDVDDPEMQKLAKRSLSNGQKLYCRHLLWGSSERSMITFTVSLGHTFKGSGDYPMDVRSLAQVVLYELRKGRRFNWRVPAQHQAAMLVDGRLFGAAKKLTVPTLLIHGTTDPQVPFAHGKKFAEVIPGAKTLWLEGMGHDLPRPSTAKMIPKIIEHLASAASRSPLPDG